MNTKLEDIIGRIQVSKADNIAEIVDIIYSMAQEMKRMDKELKALTDERE